MIQTMLQIAAAAGTGVLCAAVVRRGAPEFSLVLALAAVAFGQVETALCGAVALVVMAKVMDAVLYGTDASKVAIIVSDCWQEIADVLLREQDRGVTILRGQGA